MVTFRLARHDLRRGHVGGFQARRAVSVDLHARDRIGKVGVERRYAPDIGSLVADGHDAAQHHVVHQRSVEFVAIAHRAQHVGGEVERHNLVQRAVGAAAAARCAHGVVDVAVGHESSLP